MRKFRYNAKWFKEEEDFLRLCVERNMTAGKIAKEWPSHCPARSRNAILGKLHRENIKLYYCKDGEPHKALEEERRKKRESYLDLKKRKKPVPVYFNEPGVFNEPNPDVIPFFDVTAFRCVFPVISKPSMFCGHPTLHHYPYCEYHKCISYKK